jgi:hypothetical protein
VLGDLAEDLDAQLAAGDEFDDLLDGAAEQAGEQSLALAHPAADGFDGGPGHEASPGTREGEL